MISRQRGTKLIRKEKMLGNFNHKLDKDTCGMSLVVISLIALSIISCDLFNVLNISGVFKQ